MEVQSTNKCTISVRNGSITVQRACADRIAKQQGAVQALSSMLGREISFLQCINPSTGEVKKLVIDTVGQPTSTALNKRRVCDCQEIQVSNHTHPVSEFAKFSETDIRTVGSRLNEGIDNCGCVVGATSSMCWCGLVLPHLHHENGLPLSER